MKRRLLLRLLRPHMAAQLCHLPTERADEMLVPNFPVRFGQQGATGGRARAGVEGRRGLVQPCVQEL